jgi:multiple sugar transport system substrate-binding protein
MTSNVNLFDLDKLRTVQITRRRVVQTATAATAALAIPSVMRPGHTVAQNATLNVLAPAWPQVPVEQELVGKFAEETGIAVNIEAAQYVFLEQQIKQLVSAGSTQYDIYDYDSQWIGGLVALGALERLDTPEYLGSADATIAFDDFFPELTYRLAKYPTNDAELTAGNFAAFAETPVYGLPWSINCQALWYRTDLMDAPPETWDELREMAKALTGGGVYGMAFQGSREGDFITSDFLPIMWGNGGELWDATTYTAEGYVNSPEAVAALETMRAMIADDQSVDPASGNWTINERFAAILQGKTAMALNWVPLFGGAAEDPAGSLVAGKIGLAPSPKGPESQAAMYGCQGSGINANSERKAEAWQYLQWLTAQEQQQAIMDDIRAGFQSPRQDLKDAGQYPWQQAFVAQIPIVRDFWNIPEYAPLLNSLQTQLNLGYVGRKTPQEALDDAAIEQQAIYDNSPDKPANAATPAPS